MRYVPKGFIFETKGSMCFAKKDRLLYLLALYNTKVIQEYLGIVSPTLDYHEGPVGRTPVIFNQEKQQDIDNICLSENRTLSSAGKDNWGPRISSYRERRVSVCQRKTRTCCSGKRDKHLLLSAERYPCCFGKKKNQYYGIR